MVQKGQETVWSVQILDRTATSFDKILYLRKSNAFITCLFSVILHYIIVLYYRIIIFLLEKTTSETKCSEGSKPLFFSALVLHGKSESAAF